MDFYHWYSSAFLIHKFERIGQFVLQEHSALRGNVSSLKSNSVISRVWILWDRASLGKVHIQGLCPESSA